MQLHTIESTLSWLAHSNTADQEYENGWIYHYPAGKR
jgi:hypothetical protein